MLAIFFKPHGLQISRLRAQENDDGHGDFATSYFIVSVMPA
jgi:hypothetical protein